MPKIKIIPSVTLHVKDEKESVPFKYDRDGFRIQGRTVVTEIPPGRTFEIDEQEGFALVDLGRAKLAEEPAEVAEGA